jgi:hypothetical protein
MDVDPYCLHVYWEVTHSDKQKILAQLDKNSPPPRQVIRVYDVTLIDFDTANAHSHFDIEADGNRGNWYIDLWSPSKSLCAEIGMKSSHGIFYPIARSNFIDTPRDCLSHTGEEQWMSVSGDYEEVSILPKKPRAEKPGVEDTLHHSEKVFQGTDPGRPYISQPGKETPLKNTSSAKEEHPAEKTALKNQHSPALPHSYRDKIPSQKQVTETELKGYYEKLQLRYRREDKNIKSSPATNPHLKHNPPSEEGCTPGLLPDLTTHCGSDTRWEKEKLQKK